MSSNNDSTSDIEILDSTGRHTYATDAEDYDTAVSGSRNASSVDLSSRRGGAATGNTEDENENEDLQEHLSPDGNRLHVQETLRNAWTSAGGDPDIAVSSKRNSDSAHASKITENYTPRVSFDSSVQDNARITQSFSSPDNLNRVTSASNSILGLVGRSNSTSSNRLLRVGNSNKDVSSRPYSTAISDANSDQEIVVVDLHENRNSSRPVSRPKLSRNSSTTSIVRRSSQRSTRSGRRRSIIADEDTPEDLALMCRASENFVNATAALESAKRDGSASPAPDWNSGWHSTGPYLTTEHHHSSPISFVNPFVPFAQRQSITQTTTPTNPSRTGMTSTEQIRSVPPVVIDATENLAISLSDGYSQEYLPQSPRTTIDDGQKIRRSTSSQGRPSFQSGSGADYNWMEFSTLRPPSTSQYSHYSRPSYDRSSMMSNYVFPQPIEAPSRTGIFRVIRDYTSPKERVLLCIAVFFAIVAGLTRPIVSIVLGKFTNAFVIYGANRTEAHRETLITKADHLTIYVVIIGCVSLIACFGSTTIFQIVSASVVRRLRKAVFDAALRQDIAYHEQFGSSQMINLIDTEASVIQEAIGDKVAQFALYSATFISGFIIAIVSQWKLGITLGLTVLPTILGVGTTFQILVAVYATKAAKVYAQASAISEEITTAIRTVYAFEAQDKLLDKYYDKLESSLSHSTVKSFFRSLVISTGIFIIFSAYALAFYYGTILVIHSNVTSGQVITVFFAILVSCLGLTSAAPVLDSFTRASTATSVIYQVILRQPAMTHSGFAMVDNPNEQDLIFKSVMFSYPTRPDIRVLKGIDLRIRAGSVTALVGGSGSGKSTLLQLLLRFYEANRGKITLGDQHTLQDLDLRWYRQNIGYLPQEPHLFSVSIKENVLLGLNGHTKSRKTAQELQDMVETACKKASAHDFIMNLPNKYETLCGDRGSLLSGGQKQRVAIARAIISDPAILMFDEPTSALDAESEAYVQAALDQVCIGKTTITVAHRLSTIRNADAIVVMHAGEISEIGTHDELMARRGEYAQLVAQQQPVNSAEGNSQNSFTLSVENDTTANYSRPPSTNENTRDTTYSVKPNTSNRLSTSDSSERATPTPPNPLQKKEETSLTPLVPPRTIRPISVDRHSDATLIDDRNSALYDNKTIPLSPSLSEHPSPITLSGIPEEEKLMHINDDFKGYGQYALVKPTLKGKKQSANTPKEPIELPLWFTFSRILRMARGFRWLLIVSSLMTIISGALYPILAIILGKLIDSYQTALADGDTDKLMRYGNFYGLMFFILALVGLLSLCMEWFGFSSMADRLAVRIRLNIIDALLHLPISFFDEKDNSVTALVSFVDSSAQNIVGVAGSTLGAILESVFTLLAGAIVSIVFGWRLALVTIAAVPAVIFLGIMRGRRKGAQEKETRELFKEAVTVVGQTFSGFRVVTAYPTISEVMSQRFDDLQEVPCQVWIKKTPIHTFIFGVTQMCLIWIIALAFWYGSREIAANRFTVGSFYTVFIAVVFGAMHAGTMLLYASDISKAKSMARNVIGLIARAAQSAPKRARMELVQPVLGRISFENIEFSYPSRPDVRILSNMTFDIEPGQSVAFVGESGSGKSTITNLLYRFYDPTNGFIKLDGRSIHDLDIGDYRGVMAFVQQEPMLFNGTIRFNISIGCDEEPTDEDILTACEEAGIAEFIEGLPDGINTDLGSRGASLSGGQKQRIAIARALIRKPKILILDEATSALDAESERHVQEALDRASEGRTTITIAHRLATVARCDKICVVSNGRIVDIGTHNELISRGGFYARMASRQMLT